MRRLFVGVMVLMVLEGAVADTRAQSLPAAPTNPVDDLLASMSTVDKVGQLFMLSFSGSTAAGALAAIQEFRAGGLVFIVNTPSAPTARALIADLQAQAGASNLLPLLISTNHEGGSIQMVSSGVTIYGPNWSLGQVRPISDALAAACERGVVQGRELRSIGVSMNLAPDLDVLDNPQNTVIGTRAFSDDPNIVATLGEGYIEGLQSQGVLAVGKHFPGHGSTTADSHVQLPVLYHDRDWLDSHELVPFRAAMLANVASIMVAHISFPLLDDVAERPSSLSPRIVTDLLRNDMAYGGLIVTDDLGAMQAITAQYSPEESAIEAVEAGSDMLIVVGTPERQRRMVQAVLQNIGGRISQARLDASVRRVLVAKQQAGLLGGATVPIQPPISTCP
jgi:beta-N-acetylhexosaminidase